MKTTELQTQIDVKSVRRAELAARRNEIEEVIEAAENELAKAFAEGIDPNTVTVKLAALRDEASGVEKGVELLTSDIAELRDELTRATVTELTSARVIAEEEFWAAQKKAEETFSTFWKNFSSNEKKAFAEAVNRYHLALVEEEAATGRKTAVRATEHPLTGQIQRVIFAVTNALDPIAGGYGVHDVHDPHREPAPLPAGDWRNLAQVK